MHPVHRESTLSFLNTPGQELETGDLKLHTDMGALDVLSSIPGVGDFDRVRHNAIEELFGRRCRVISLEDLIRAKETSTREKDWHAVLELRAVGELLAKKT